MRPLSTFLLLSILAFASACSKSNYAQVEPDDLYFTHKDRKASQAYNNVSASASTATADAEYNSTNADVSTYSSQHSPTLQSTTLGSPTIQQNEEPFYDASQNPDYLLGQEVEYVEGVSDAYYMEDYASYNTASTQAVPQTINNYYGTSQYGYNPYYSSYSRWGSPYSSWYYSPFSFSIGFGYNPYGFGYNPYRRYSYASYYGYGYSDFYYSGYPNYFNSYAYCLYPTVNNNDYYTNANYATNSTQVVNAPRKSRSSVSYYANKQNYNIVRRDNYVPGTEGGRIIVSENGGRFTPTDGRTNSDYVSRRTSQATNVANRKSSATQSSGTIQRNSNTVYRYRTNTVSRPVTNTRRSDYVNSGSPTKRQSRTYVNQSDIRRTSNVSRSSNRNTVNNNSNRTTRSRYTTPSSSNSNSSYGRTKTNSSYRSQRTNSRSRSSYSPSRSSSGSRSSYSPSRSSSSSRSRSYSAPKSSSSRSSGTRSSGRSSSSSTSKRKQ